MPSLGQREGCDVFPLPVEHPGLAGRVSAQTQAAGGAVPQSLAGVHQQVLSWSLRRVWLFVMGSITGGRDESQEPIRTRQAAGPAQVFWQALLAGDRETVAEILRDPQNNLSPSAVFDTSDLEEWKNYRFNTRRLSTWEQWGSACGVICGA